MSHRGLSKQVLAYILCLTHEGSSDQTQSHCILWTSFLQFLHILGIYIYIHLHTVNKLADISASLHSQLFIDQPIECAAT